jgi:hypothetical protein
MLALVITKGELKADSTAYRLVLNEVFLIKASRFFMRKKRDERENL